jgi:phosphoribosyl 1,2-cyclic phosphate phosphodiesterase
MYGPPDALERMAKKFPYIFDDSMRPLPGTSKPEGTLHPILPGAATTIGDIDVIPAALPHGLITVYGYRIGPLAYITDAKTVPADVIALMRGAKVLVVNALFRTEHPTHLSVPEAVRVAKEIGAERTFLTHLTHDNFHADLEAELPRGVAPAFDGLTVKVE